MSFQEKAQITLDRLAAEYSELLGIDKEYFMTNIRIDRGKEAQFSPLNIKENHTTVTLLSWAPLFVQTGILEHELKHFIHYKTIEKVVSENPTEFLTYLGQEYSPLKNHIFNDEHSQQLLKKFQEKWQSIGLQPQEFTKDISYMIWSINHNCHNDFVESFAGYPRYNFGDYTMFAGLAINGFSILQNLFTNQKITPAQIGISLALVAGTYFSQKHKDKKLALKDQLRNFPTQDIKYLLAEPPKKGINYYDHFNKLRTFGFPTSLYGKT